MKRNNLWKLLLVGFLLLWSANELYPPTSRNLVDEFESRAEKVDTNLTAIVKRARELDKAAPEKTYQSLVLAIGTNDITPYFPKFQVGAERDPNHAILNRLQRDGAGKVRLGLDLQGGTSFLVSMDTNKLTSASEKSRVLSQAVEVLRKRVDRFGVAEPLIQPIGDDRILIQLPGLSESDYEIAKSTIGRPAFLQFRMIHEQSAEFVRQGLTEPGYELLKERRKDSSGREMVIPYLVKKRPEDISGKSVKSAGVYLEPITGKPGIHFKLDDKGAESFARITRENIGRQLGIVLDGELYSAPRINGEIPLGSGQIEGTFTIQEAYELANVLENPLEAAVSIIEEQRVEATLGKDSIASGIRASIIGTVAVMVFMAAYYMIGGVIANVALLTNIVILLGAMCSIGTTLTLPGIAGIVLTIGMAVDANVLIFERIREELAAGKTLRGAISAGYDRAFSTIFDSHVTTLISSVILIFMGTGPVKGFGVSLTIGVALSLFTALVVTRLIFDWLLDRGMITRLPMLQLIRPKGINFMRWAKPAFALSWSIILIGIGYGIYRGNNALGVDFRGGDRQTFSFQQRVDLEKVRQTLTALKVGEPAVGYQKSLGRGTETLQVTSDFGTADKVAQSLQQQYPEAKFSRLELGKVGKTVSDEIARVALLSSLLALFGILVYVALRYEYSFAIGAVIAVLHDVLMTLGCFFMDGRQLNAPMVAAVLTIIGFSINDTIVIFDRIREDLKMGVRGTFTELMNHALNQTLSRTIITSGTVFLSTLALFLFAGSVINDFAFTFLVGIITGTYSSIYIASALVLWWHKGQRPQIGSRVAVTGAQSAAVQQDEA